QQKPLHGAAPPPETANVAGVSPQTQPMASAVGELQGEKGVVRAVEIPSIEPDKELDDMEVIARTVRQWAQKNFDKKDENPDGFRNVILYYKMAVQYGVEAAARERVAQAPGPPTRAGFARDGVEVPGPPTRAGFARDGVEVPSPVESARGAK